MHATAPRPTWQDVTRQLTPAGRPGGELTRGLGPSEPHPPRWDARAHARPSGYGTGLRHDFVHVAPRLVAQPEAIAIARRETPATGVSELFARLVNWLREGQVAELSETLARVQRNQRALIRSHETLQALSHLEADWDSYGAVPPSPQAIATAYGIVLHLWRELADTTATGIEPWTTAPLHNGGIQFEWKGPLGIVETEVGRDGTISLLVEQDDETVYESDPGSNVAVAEVVRRVRETLGH